MPSSAADVRQLSPRDPDLRTGSEVLARAFRDNPMNRAVIGAGDARRLRCNRPGMRGLLASAADRGAVLASGAPGEPAGLLVAVPPGRFPLPPPSLPAQLLTLAIQGPRVARRWARVFEDLLVRHPEEPHWYLASVGVRPEVQHRGLGGALLAEFLRRVDADGAPAYLETDRSERVGFYERRGFRVAGEAQPLGVSIWCMWRDAPEPLRSRG